MITPVCLPEACGHFSKRLSPSVSKNGRTNHIIYDALVTSDICLPALSHRPISSFDRRGLSKVHIHYCPGGLSRFSSLALIGCDPSRQVKAYEAPEGLLICLPANLKVLIERTGKMICLDYDDQNAYAHGLAVSISVNIALAISSLFRRRIPLHAAGVSLEGKTIGIMAPSGTGKSTLLSFLLEQGGIIVTDDVLVVHKAGKRIQSFPSHSLYAKIDRQMAEKRLLELDSLMELIPESQEYWHAVSLEERITDVTPLDCLFYLSPLAHPETPTELAVHRARSDEYINILMGNTQGFRFAHTMVNAMQFTNGFEQIVKNVPLFVLEYARNYQILPSLAKAIREASKLSSADSRSNGSTPAVHIDV